MEVEILSVKICRGFNVLCAPIDLCREFVENFTENCKFPALYVCSESLSIDSKRNRNFHVKRCFTLNHTMDSLLDAYEKTIFIEHNPSLFKSVDFQTFEDFIQLLREIGREKLLIYFTSKRDRIFDFISSLADRYVYIEEDVGGYYIADVNNESINQRFYSKNLRQLALKGALIVFKS